MDETASKYRGLKITISWTAIFKILLACLLALLAIKLYRFAELLILAALIAVAFRPLIRWTRKHHWPNWTAVTLCGLILLGVVGLFVGVMVPTITEQGGELAKKLPEIRETVLDRLPPDIRDSVDRLFTQDNVAPVMKKAVELSGAVVVGLFEFFMVLIFAIYFVADGDRFYRWLVAFLPEKDRRKMAAASDEIASVASHYIIGQVITSALCAAYAFGVLQILHVPNAALLAIIAGIFDVLPLIGFFLFTIPALAVALSVSPATAGIVAILYLAYHLFENYFIVPKVYGDRLKLSMLAVLLACLAAGLVSGVVGVIIVLPLVACYPVIEHYWLRRHLQPDTVDKHVALEADEKNEKRPHRPVRGRHATT